MSFFFVTTTEVDVWELIVGSFLTLFIFLKDDPIKPEEAARTDGVARSVEADGTEEISLTSTLP